MKLERSKDWWMTRARREGDEAATEIARLTAEREALRAELAAAHRLLDDARYELRFEGSADLLDRIDATLSKGGKDE